MNLDSEAVGMQFEIRDTDVTYSANRKGLVYFNKVADKIRAFFNTEMKTIATEDWVLSSISNSEDNLSLTGITVANQASSPSTPDAGKTKLYPKSDGYYQKQENGQESKFLTNNNHQGYVSAMTGFRKGVNLDITETDTNDPYDQHFWTAPAQGLLILKRTYASNESTTVNVTVGTSSKSIGHSGSDWKDHNDVYFVDTGDQIRATRTGTYATQRSVRIQATFVQFS